MLFYLKAQKSKLQQYDANQQHNALGGLWLGDFTMLA